jgi:hypothetical protein
VDLDEETWIDLEEKMLKRTRDRVPVVRVHAVAALNRLQQHSDPECPVTAQYKALLFTDTSKDVRKAILRSIIISRVCV